jgi:hypothetical protein
MAQISTKTKLQFSGHETFPLRQLWLRKAYEAVNSESGSGSKSLFSDDDSIARFGVGKNMVSSIRFWATACQIIEDDETEGGYRATKIGDAIFNAKSGLDPYCERSATTWLMHWILASTPEQTSTWYYIFNHVSQQVFDKDGVATALAEMVAEKGQRVAGATLKRDVDCCLRSYVPRAGGTSHEEMSEPLLGELGLIQQNAKGTFEFRRGTKRSLPDGIFAYALLDYWQRLEHSGSVMAFDRVAHDYGSPGRVFKLDENAVADRLMSLEGLSKNQIQWTEQAGIRQVTRSGTALNNIEEFKMKLLRAAYVKG